MRSATWSGLIRRQPCTTTSQDATSACRSLRRGATRAPALGPIPAGATDDAARPTQRRADLARAVDCQAAPRRAPERHDALDRGPATTRPAAHPHARHESLPHLGSGERAARAVRLAATPVDGPRCTAQRAPPLPRFSSVPMDDTTDLRTLAEAVDSVRAGEARVRELVARARANGRSWGDIGIALGVSRQAARERFAEKTRA